MPDQKTLVGFGFGAIQAGLFLWEAQQSGAFGRLVVVMPNEEVVAGLRRAGGAFRLNIATRSAREVGEVRNVEILNPDVPRDRQAIVEAIAEASELSTALPSVATYEQTGAAGRLLADGLWAKMRRPRPAPCIAYVAENHNDAAALLLAAVKPHLPADMAAALPSVFQALDTVIGKMSRVVRDPGEIAGIGLVPYVEGGSRAYLVESFNRIMVSKVALPGFRRGLPMFVEKDDLLPFEEAKLYGHNAAHALLGFLARQRGYRFIAEASADGALMATVRGAFLEESGRALIARRGGVDPLFTPAGYAAFADDLLGRMVNPWLRDDVERVTRDSRRKLAWDDRFVGTMRLALAAGVEPHRFAQGAAAALELLQRDVPSPDAAGLLDEIWAPAAPAAQESQRVRSLILQAMRPSRPA